jgi:hypothetical protein
MEMPPEGKAGPLSSNQVALIRAWIDQGVVWDEAAVAAQSAPSLAISPEASWTDVHGDQSKFRELEWRPEGWNGGADDFDFHQTMTDGRSVFIQGHALRNDYALSLDLRKPDLGFVKFDFQQFRKYYSDAGGYYAAFSPPLYHLDQDLHLDNGRAAVQIGLTLPNLPRIVLGYEYQYKDGSESMLTWGPVYSPTGNPLDIRNIYPSAKQIEEHTHIVRFDLAYDISGWQFENNFRAEFYDLDTRRTDALAVLPGAAGPVLLTQIQEAHNYNQFADTVHFQKEIAEWWLASAGYRYSWLDGDAAYRLMPQDNLGQLAAGSAWSADDIVLHEIWQVCNANSQFRLLPQLTATVALQGQWKRQDTFGDVNLDEVIDPADPTAGIQRFPTTEHSTLDEADAEENLLVRFTGLPFTSLFAEAKAQQENYMRTADQVPSPDPIELASDANVHWQDYRVGFSSSPWSRISFGGDYQHRDHKTDYQYSQALSVGAYPGFILSRDISADEAEARLVLRPANWLKTTLTYQWTDSDYRTVTAATSATIFGSDATQGGPVFAGRYNAQTFSANATLTPFRRIYLSGTVSYQKNSTTTADNGSQSVAPYRGHLWSLLVSVTYVLDNATDLFANYTLNTARYAQHDIPQGLPLGLDYDHDVLQLGVVRRLSRTVTARLQYAYYNYEEPSSAHLLDYRAHQILGVVSLKW